MANMNFGVNILPKANNTYSLGNSSYKWHAYLTGINGQAIEDLVLPPVDSTDNGKVLKVVSGIWATATESGGSSLPTVSSTDNGKILQVSSGAWSIVTPNFLTSHQDISGLAPKADPVFTGSISLGRYNNSTVGTRSVAIGYAAIASDSYALALGYDAQATKSHSHAMGFHLKASSDYSTVLGLYNLENQMPADVSRWASNTDYTEGDHAAIPTVNQDNTIIYPKYRCITTHNSGDSIVKDNWILEPNFCFIIGNGANEANRGNAVAIDWDGNGYYKGDLYIDANFKTNFGSKVATEAYVTSALANFGGGITGVTLVSTTLTPDSNGMVTIPAMTGATSNAAGTAGLVPAPATTDVDKFLAGDGTYKSGGLPMVILSYGSSTWNDFINAYNNNVIVYCRASSNSNPASGSQTRMAFMAYVNNATSPTSVEFQYYRSVNSSSKSISQLSDQVFVYKLDKTAGWTVATREASIKSVVFDASSGLTGTYNNSTGVLTITAAT